MMTIYEDWTLYGDNPIWWINLVDSRHAAVERISQQQAMGEIAEMMRWFGIDIPKSCLTTVMRRKTEVQVVVEPECVFDPCLHPSSFPTRNTHTH